MLTKAFHSAVFVFVVLVAASAMAAGNWVFLNMYTLDPVIDGIDGTFYLNNGGEGHGAAVKSGALAQFIIGINGAAIVDPLDYFDTNDSGDIDGAELTAVQTWVNNGADPSDLSANNVLVTGNCGLTGEFGLPENGKMNWCAGEPPPLTNVGMGQDYIALRVWNLTKEELEDWCTVPGQQIWYITDREMGFFGGRDTGWNVGMGALELGEDPTDWTFCETIGVEVFSGTRDFNELDKCLGVCIPEPGTMLLVGLGALSLLVCRKRAA